jgi:hypothetical protein
VPALIGGTRQRQYDKRLQQKAPEEQKPAAIVLYHIQVLCIVLYFRRFKKTDMPFSPSEVRRRAEFDETPLFGAPFQLLSDPCTRACVDASIDAHVHLKEKRNPL